MTVSALFILETKIKAQHNVTITQMGEQSDICRSLIYFKAGADIRDYEYPVTKTPSADNVGSQTKLYDMNTCSRFIHVIQLGQIRY